MVETGRKYNSMLELVLVPNQDLTLRNISNKHGISGSKSDIEDLKKKVSNKSDLDVNLDEKLQDDNKDDSDAESEIMIWIDFWNTPHPQLRNPILSFSEEENSHPVEKQVEQNSKTEEDNDPFRIPDTSQVAKSRANSEKSVNQNKLLTHSTSCEGSNLTKSSSGKLTKMAGFNIFSLVVANCKASNEEGIVKDGKSFDNTNASVQNNENEHIIEDKEAFEPIPNDSQGIKIQNVNFDPDFDNNEFLDRQNEIQEDEEFKLGQFMSHPHKELEHNKDQEMSYDCELQDNEFNMSLSESIEQFDQEKQLPLESFEEPRINMNVLPAEEPCFEHHSGFLQDDYIGSPHYYD